MFTEDELLPLSALVDIVFCERRAALHQLEYIWEDNVATVEGHGVHDRVHGGEDESRGDLRITRSLRIRSLELGVSGIADVVEFHRAKNGAEGITVFGMTGHWMPFPVEYKRGIRRHEESFEVQLCAQTMCLEEMLNCRIPKGALFYGLSKRRQEVAFSPDLRRTTKKAAERLHDLVKAGVTPPAQFDKRCKKCSLLDKCMPQLAGKCGSAQEYLNRTLENIVREENSISN